MIITPKRLELDEARRLFRKILKESGFSIEDLLAGLEEEREIFFKKTYGKKTVKVFLDSNVILSGVISDKGARRILLDILTLNLLFLTGVTGQFNVIEIERNFMKKMPKAVSVYKNIYLS